jgi:rhamnulokinase
VRSASSASKSSQAIHCAAVDLGATSGRVIVGTWADRHLELTEVHRFPNGFESLGARDYWDLPGLWADVRTGLREAAARFSRIASVGVDTWGVDYVLLNDAGRLVFPAHAYRDARTQPGLKRLADSPADLARIYAATGIPNVFYNSSLQLAEVVASCPEIKTLASRCLFLPDYFNYLLSGRMENELTIASTSQLLDVHSTGWSRFALRHFGVPARWFSQPVLAGTLLGPVTGLPELTGAKVVAGPGHDTAAAYDAMPADPDGGDLFLSSGTWSLVGVESDRPVLGPGALAARVANERTGDGRYRPLTNIIGFWLLEGVMKALPDRPHNEEERVRLSVAAAALPAPKLLLGTADPVFANPPSMRAAIDAQLKAGGARPPRDPPGYLRLICDSLAQGHAIAKTSFERMTGRRFRRILAVGGGSRNPLLCQATADAAGIPVVSYSLEGAAVGNLARQLIALGAVKDLPTFRACLAGDLTKTVYSPRAG